MSRADRFDFTLDEETEKRLYELLTDMDTRKTDRFWIQDKRGYHAEYVKVIRCKDCRHYTGKWCTIYSTKQFDINDIYKDDDDFCSQAERSDGL